MRMGVESYQTTRKPGHSIGKPVGGGVLTSCSNLGLLYQNGHGVKQDDFQAANLFRKACDGGASSGCGNLATAYLRGRGVPQDESEALTYFSKGCELKNPKSCEQYSLLKKGKLK